MDKTNSLNSEMLRLMSEVFNSVDLVQSDLDELADVLEGFALYLIDKDHAESLVRVLRAQGWTICPPLPALLESASGGDGEAEEHEKVKVGGTCVD